jgi:hypothetical protein
VTSHRDIEKAMARWDKAKASNAIGEFFSSVRGAPPDWYFVENGRTYPVKGTWAHASGINCREFNTNESKRLLARAGFGSFINLTLNRLPEVQPQRLVLSDLDKQSARFGGGESTAHADLKDWISSNPGAVGLAIGHAGVTEFPLPSGDKIDVFFEAVDGVFAVEVKPSRSPVEDLNRGLFQVVKYRAVLEMLSRLNGGVPVDVRLAIGGTLPDTLRTRAKKMNVTVIEGVVVGKVN